MKATLLVFLKYPESGKVKTRLAWTIGPERAACMYRQWIGVVLGQLQLLRPGIRIVGFHDGAERDAFREWHGLVDDWWPQPFGDLGDRLEAGFARSLCEHVPVSAIGTDCLEVDVSLVEQAHYALREKDIVFGPTEDGGYYLVGMSKPHPGLFRSVRWSSSFTLADHLRRCEEEGWPFALLPKLRDIDTWDDWNSYLVRTGRSPEEFARMGP